MIYILENENLRVKVSSLGAEMQSIRRVEDGTEYLWQGDSKYWTSSAPNLFPYVGRLTQGYYLSEGKSFSMKNHGIARYRDFHLVSNDGTTLVLELILFPQISECLIHLQV